MKVRDVRTHFAVPATINITGPQAFVLATDANGHVKQPVPPGEYHFEITAPGYQTMRTHTGVADGQTVDTTMMLDPVHHPQEEDSVASRLKPGYTLLHGYAIDTDGQPVSGVRVYSETSGVETVTDQRGAYFLSVPTPEEIAPALDLPGMDTIIAEKQGYKTDIHRNLSVAMDDGGGIFFELKSGRGSVEHDDMHKLTRSYLESQKPKEPEPDRQ